MLATWTVLHIYSLSLIALDERTCAQPWLHRISQKTATNSPEAKAMTKAEFRHGTAALSLHELAKVLLDCSGGTAAGKALSHRIGRAAPGAQGQRAHDSTFDFVSLARRETSRMIFANGSEPAHSFLSEVQAHSSLHSRRLRSLCFMRPALNRKRDAVDADCCMPIEPTSCVLRLNSYTRPSQPGNAVLTARAPPVCSQGRLPAQMNVQNQRFARLVFVASLHVWREAAQPGSKGCPSATQSQNGDRFIIAVRSIVACQPNS